MTNLRRLSLHEVLLPYDFICQIPTLTNLRELEIKSCDIESMYTYEQVPEEGWDLGTQSSSPNNGLWDDDASPMQSPETQAPVNSTGNPWTSTTSATGLNNLANTTRITHLTLLGIQMSLEPLLVPSNLSGSYFRRYTGGIEYFYRTIVTPSLTYLHTTSFELTSINKIFEDLATSYASSSSLNEENTGEQHPMSNDTEDEASDIFQILNHLCVSCCVRASGADVLLQFLWRFGRGITRLELSNRDDSDSSNQFREWVEGNLSPLVQNLNSSSNSSSSSSSTTRRFLPNLTSYAGPSILLDILYRGRELRDVSIRDRLPKIGRSDWRAEDGDTGTPAVETLLDALEGWGLTNNTSVQQVANALVFGNNQQNQNLNLNINFNQDANLQDLLSHWVANRTPQRSQLSREALEVDMKKLEDVKVAREMAEYLGRTVQMAIRQLGSKGIMLERLELTLVIWDIDLLLMVVNIMPSLKELEIRCYKQGPDEVCVIHELYIFHDRRTKLV